MPFFVGVYVCVCMCDAGGAPVFRGYLGHPGSVRCSHSSVGEVRDEGDGDCSG